MVTEILCGLALAVVLPEIALQYHEQAHTIDWDVVAPRYFS